MRDEVIKNYSRLHGQLNKETREHSLSVASICEECAPELGLFRDICFKIGYLHDVGKIFIPSRILKKNMSLNHAEREVVDLHSYFGYRLLSEAGEPAIVCLPVLFHHGFNKPRLSEPDEPITEEILRYVALVHSVDIFDAMSRTRPYHDGFERNEVMKVLGEDPMSTPEVIKVLGSVDFAVQKNSQEQL